jgi:nicotinamide mononucleotide transporter
MVSVFGYPLSYLEAVTTVLTLACIIFAARANIATFALGIICTTLSFFFFYQARLYSSMALQVIFFSFNVYGYYQWTRPKKGKENEKNQLKVSRYKNNSYLLFAGIIVVGTLLWGLLVSNPPAFLANEFAEAQYPYVDAFILVASVVAQFMIAKKKIENWIIWIVVDIIATVLYAASGAVFMSILYGILIFNAVYGLYEWKKMYKYNK